MISRLVAQADGRIKIMAGSGVRPENAALIAATGADAIHFSARTLCEGGMRWRKEGISMGGSDGISEYDRLEADPKVIARIMEAIKKDVF